MGWVSRESLPNSEREAEFNTSVCTLQSREANQSLSRCIVIWIRSKKMTGSQYSMPQDLSQQLNKGVHKWKTKPWQWLGTVNKIQDYLLGLSKFTIETDHKALLALLKTKLLDELTARIQWFRMRLMRFSYDIVYTVGKNLMTADTLSWAPGSAPADQEYLMEDETNAFVCAVIDSIPASDARLEEIREKQCSDKICSQVMNFCKLDHWPESAKKDVNLRQYRFARQDLTVQQGLLLFQSRLVIPAELQEEMLQRLHQDHQGVVKCRALARSCVWWPGLSKKIEEVVGACATCEKERKLPPEPLQPTKTPDYPWQKVVMDMFELNGQSYLIVVDSHWIETATWSRLHQQLSWDTANPSLQDLEFQRQSYLTMVHSSTLENSWNSPKTIVLLILPAVPIILKETVEQKGLFRQWKIFRRSPLTLTLPFSTTVQLHFYMATAGDSRWSKIWRAC